MNRWVWKCRRGWWSEMSSERVRSIPDLNLTPTLPSTGLLPSSPLPWAPKLDLTHIWHQPADHFTRLTPTRTHTHSQVIYEISKLSFAWNENFATKQWHFSLDVWSFIFSRSDSTNVVHFWVNFILFRETSYHWIYPCRMQSINFSL